MTESHTENAAGTWSVPQCPFAIEYSLRVLDDIRLGVMDAFFSLPRGGAEIGGVLVGKFADGRLVISDYVALDCEHAMGPSFTLSQNDEARLEELLADVSKGSAGVPVGWYHSHTRSEIFLSDADLMIHRRFFPEPWQVALVMKPHTFQPMRCGFFFREAGGSVQAAATYQEFILEPLPVRPIPSGDIPQPAETAFRAADKEDGRGTMILVEATPVGPVTVPVQPAPPAAPQPEPPPVAQWPEPPPATQRPEPPPVATQPEPEPPGSLSGQPAPERSSHWLKVVAALVLAVALGFAGYQTRHVWWPKSRALFTPAPQAANTFASLGLVTVDTDGQLQIHWDRFATAVRQATGGKLTINDTGVTPREIKLDSALLQAGSFTYAREGDSVTVMLTVNEPNGKEVHEVAAFVGKAPPPRQRAAASNPELRKQRDAALDETARLQKELAAQQDRTQNAIGESTRLRKELAAQQDHARKLQKQLDDARALVREQQRKRLVTQAPK